MIIYIYIKKNGYNYRDSRYNKKKKKKNPFYFNPISNFSRGKFKLNLVEDLNENSFNVIP